MVVPPNGVPPTAISQPISSKLIAPNLLNTRITTMSYHLSIIVGFCGIQKNASNHRF